jgi:hypothetical protein
MVMKIFNLEGEKDYAEVAESAEFAEKRGAEMK